MPTGDELHLHLHLQHRSVTIISIQVMNTQRGQLARALRCSRVAHVCCAAIWETNHWGGGGNGKSPVRDWEREREEAPESHLGPRKSEKVRDGREEKKEKKDIIKCLDGAVRWRLESSAWLLAPSAGAEGNPSSYRACVFKWWWLNAQA